MIEPTLVEFEERLREAVNDPHEGKRKCEANWPIHRIHYERNRYIYDLYYRQEKLSRQLYEFLVREKVVDGALISKWRKPGYEILCSMSAIQKGNTNFGTTSICRVPYAARRADHAEHRHGLRQLRLRRRDQRRARVVTDPYGVGGQEKSDRKQQRRAEEPLDPDIEARLKALRGETSSDVHSGGGGGAASSGGAADAEAEPQEVDE